MYSMNSSKRKTKEFNCGMSRCNDFEISQIENLADNNEKNRKKCLSAHFREVFFSININIPKLANLI